MVSFFLSVLYLLMIYDHCESAQSMIFLKTDWIVYVVPVPDFLPG